jgi:ribosomal protein S18 acetylase RimI-like enzyme
VEIDPDRVAQAIAQATLALCDAAEFGWFRRRDGVLAFHSTAPFWVGNGVMVERRDATAATVAALLDELDATGLPYSLQLRPGCRGELERIPTERGMQRQEDQPLMVTTEPCRAEPTSADQFSVCAISPSDAGRYADLLAAGFEAPIELFRTFAHPSVLRGEGLRSYLGYVDGEPVAAGAGQRTGTGVMIMNVTTLAPYRGRGFGAVMTSRAAADGFAAGADWAFLFASPAGAGLYRRLGFRELEVWRFWSSD